MPESSLQTKAEAVRRFNRFYTRVIGVLDEGLLGTELGLTEARILYELARHDKTTAKMLQSGLRIDAGYMSRILGKFERRGLIVKTRSDQDSRQRLLTLSAEGRRTLAGLESGSQKKFETLLQALPSEDQDQLVESMSLIENMLAPSSRDNQPIVIRPHRIGDIGLVIQRHAVLYRREFGWDEEFEAVVTQILADFQTQFRPATDQSWIAEQEGQWIGSLFLAEESPGVGRLRLLLVDPRARGQGLGTILMKQCLDFARGAGYQKLVLWTMDVLKHARFIYEDCGFVRTEQSPCRQFGHDLVSETWELDLKG